MDTHKDAGQGAMPISPLPPCHSILQPAGLWPVLLRLTPVPGTKLVPWGELAPVPSCPFYQRV